MKEHIWMCVRGIRRINSKIMHVGLWIKRVFWDVIVVYAPRMERSEVERNGFWEELKGCIEVCEDRGKLEVI